MIANESGNGSPWPDARHARNLAERPEVGITIFDSSAPISTGRAVYVTVAGRLLERVRVLEGEHGVTHQRYRVRHPHGA